ncbi:MAG: hypothetical protein WEC79_06575 [Thermomicrobiales bacterium]
MNATTTTADSRKLWQTDRLPFVWAVKCSKPDGKTAWLTDDR